MGEIQLGIIGGSGLYNMPGLSDIEYRDVETPFGTPSDQLVIGTLHGQRVTFLPRHGRGHVLTPTEVPYRANIYALKSLGVKYIVGVNACGSLREHIAPGHIVVPNQLFDHTRGMRPDTFFGDGLVAHMSVADPFSEVLNEAVVDAVTAVGGTVHAGGRFITIEGPRFSTKVESHTYRHWGMDIIGMTTSPEAFLALEAEIAFSSMAHVTDYDVWHDSEDPVTVEMVIKTLQKNTEIAQNAIAHLVQHIDDWAVELPAHSALQYALITDPAQIPPETLERLSLLVGKYYKS